MADRNEDLAVEYFLELDGTVHFVDEKCKYRVEIKAKRTDVTPERPHGLSYSLTLHNEKHERILGFDNAHPVPANKGPSGKKHKFDDHKHRYGRTRIYKFEDTNKLLSDFYASVEQIMKEGGVKI
jgi:hypothetical protein